MRRLLASLLFFLACAPHPAAAQQIAYEDVTGEESFLLDTGTDRVVELAASAVPRGIAAYGPFRVLDASHAALVAVTDEHSPTDFLAMLHAYPGIAVLEMIECPGTENDLANLRLGRMIRARGLTTHVPDGGSVRSGAVELFLAGVVRSAEDSAEFAVHAWRDEYGREPGDYAPDAWENRTYLDYYRAMGMDAVQAAAFYAMTNSVPNAEAKWLDAAEMGQWTRFERNLALLDSGPRLH